jgi:hypothetical protein
MPFTNSRAMPACTSSTVMKPGSRRIVLISVSVVALPLIGLALLVYWKFPFRRNELIRQVESRTGARLEIGDYRESWFPPGFSAKNLRLTNRAGDVLTAARMDLEGSYAGLLRSPKVLPKVYARSLRLRLRLKDAQVSANGLSGGGLAVGEIRLDDLQAELLRNAPDKEPFPIIVHSLVLKNAGPQRTVAFRISMENPRPAGLVHAQGELGPIVDNDPRRTRVTGTFTVEHADLTIPRAIAGTLNASGNFHGSLSGLLCAGTADVPQFQVFGSTHQVHVAASYEAAVNAMTGDAALSKILAHFNRTTVIASGNFGTEPQRPGKTLRLNTAVYDGRVEDLLLLFTHKPRPAMEGPVSLQAKFTIPPGPRRFLTKLEIDGRFDITQAHFTNPNTQTPINRLSASAEGESKSRQREFPTLATAVIHGDVTSRNGIARLPAVAFELPGVRGQIAGTFELHQKRIAMQGVFQTSGKLADTTSGVKSLLLKAMGPIWPTKASEKSIPFRIGGNASHPLFRLKLHE